MTAKEELSDLKEKVDRDTQNVLNSAVYRRAKQKVNESLGTTEESDQQDELI